MDMWRFLKKLVGSGSWKAIQLLASSAALQKSA
jgi:hypothetical protein